MKTINPNLLPASLRRFASQVEDFSDERNNGDGLWLYLKPGLCYDGEVHCVHEYTCRDVVEAFSRVYECECKECQILLGRMKNV